jgi:DNA-binding transcriptional ArsR family regulator
MWVAGPLPSIGACDGDVDLQSSAVRPEVKGLIPPVADAPVLAREPSGGDPPELQTLLDALDDADASAIIRAIEESATANEVSERCDIRLSTTYRKLDVLTEAGLLVEGTEIRSDGHHTTASAGIATGLIVMKTGILILGGLITYFSVKAYRNTGSNALRALAVGFGIITLGALLAGTLDVLSGVPLATGVLIDAVLTLAGFAVITYSLYTD